MIELLQDKLATFDGNNQDKYNFVREYLQLLILKILSEKGHFRNIAFVGGTALRILFDLRRFSEDLDFSLYNKDNYSFTTLTQNLAAELKLLGLDIDMKQNHENAVAYVFVKFNGLLYALGLSPHKDKKITVKVEVEVEVDQNPPRGGHGVKPNLELLNYAAEQTLHENPHFDMDNLREKLTEKMANTNFELVKKDVAPFLEYEPEPEIENFYNDFFVRAIQQKF